MATAKVKFFDAIKGYGFLRPDDGSEEVFVHRNDLAGSLNELLADQAVKYDLVDAVSKKGNGKKAANVDLV